MFSTVLNFFSDAPNANVSDATICQINEQINKQKITRISKWNLDAGNIAVELDSSNCQGKWFTVSDGRKFERDDETEKKVLKFEF